jgi:hypothetical protein
MKKLSLFAIAITSFLALPLAVHASVAPPVTPVPEPTTFIAGALCLVPLAVGAVRAYRKDRK